MKERTFRVTVRSPFGKQPLEQFKNHLKKIASEAKEQWDIQIDIEELPEDNE